MKAKSTTLMIGIGMTFALIAPAAQAAKVWGGGAAAVTNAGLTVRANTNHNTKMIKDPPATVPARPYQAQRNSF
jgi:hypothetical protein